MNGRYIKRVDSSADVSLEFDTYLINATNGAIVMTLPDMTGMGSGPCLTFARVDLNQNVNVTIVPTNTTIENTTSLNIAIQSNILIVYDDGTWSLIEYDQPISYDYQFDYVYVNGVPTIYSAFEDIMDIVTLTCYDDAAILCKINSMQ